MTVKYVELEITAVRNKNIKTVELFPLNPQVRFIYTSITSSEWALYQIFLEGSYFETLLMHVGASPSHRSCIIATVVATPPFLYLYLPWVQLVYIYESIFKKCHYIPLTINEIPIYVHTYVLARKYKQTTML